MDELVDARALLAPYIQPDHRNSKAFQVCRTRLARALERLERLVAPESAARINALQEELKLFSVRVSLVGQVKAGKTALANGLIGSAGLLPSDVNPWTSVVTSIHINTPKPKGKDAVFTFFNEEEWANMVDIGGHLGEMAIRTDNDEEVVELREQIKEMQARTQARLGRNFNLLLDGYHSFLGYTPDLVKKYVCLGDDEAEQEGRYADVTKSADLYIENANFGLPTIVCDTPGVNDPFLLREAVTLDNISDTDVCVVVLSAHQAFSSVDIQLLRILLALKHEQIVLYVNRIDELQDPDRQIKEIDAYIRDLLEEQSLPKDLPIVFGSAAWAEGSVSDEMTETFEGSMMALHDFSDNRKERLSKEGSSETNKVAPGSSEFTMSKQVDLSGLHELNSILENRGTISVGRPFLERVREQALDISRQSLLYFDELSKSHSSVSEDLDYDKIFDRLYEMLNRADDACKEIAAAMSDKVLWVMSGAFRDYMIAEKAKLKEHLAQKRRIEDWQPDTDGLRRDLNLAHDEFVEIAPKRVKKVFDELATQIDGIYGTVLNNDNDLFAVRVPQAIEPKTPVSLMRTMSIDMGSGWFSSWFNKRFNQSTYVSKFDELCRAEMQQTLKEMKDSYVIAYDQQVRATLYLFLSEHMETLQKLCGLSSESARAEVKRKLGVDVEIRERQVELETVIAELNSIFKRPQPDEINSLKSVA